AGNPALDDLLDQEHYTSAAASATCFSPKASIFRRYCDELINQRRGNSRGVSAAQFPFFAKQPANFFPIAAHECLVHRAGDFRDALEIAMHVLVAVDMRFKNFRIVYALLSGRTRERNQEAGIDLLRQEGHGFTLNA